jgi:hypothetical protein
MESCSLQYVERSRVPLRDKNKAKSLVSLPLYSPNSKGTKRRRSSEVYIETIARIFPNPLTLGFTAGGGEGCEVVNYSCWTRVAIGVTNVRRRAFSFRSRDGLLAQRRFRRERGLEWRTAARRALRS